MIQAPEKELLGKLKYDRHHTEKYSENHGNGAEKVGLIYLEDEES